MPEKEFLSTVALRIVCALFFALSGVFMSLASVLGWGYWYLFCAVLWTVSGFAWLVRPGIAARLNLFPALGIAALLVRLFVWGESWPKLTDPMLWLYLLQATCALGALTADLVTIRNTRVTTFVPLAISFVLVASGFFVERVLIDRTEMRSYLMSWSADGKVPWGDLEFDKAEGPPLVIYRKYGEGYCFDEFYSAELKQRLTDQKKPLVRVEYDVTSDFGRERGYNVRSVDGVVFTIHDHKVRPGYTRGGFVALGLGAGSCEHK